MEPLVIAFLCIGLVSLRLMLIDIKLRGRRRGRR